MFIKINKIYQKNFKKFEQKCIWFYKHLYIRGIVYIYLNESSECLVTFWILIENSEVNWLPKQPVLGGF